MTFATILIPFIAAILGGTLNAVAGGGSFISFPSLIYVNVPPIPANATSTTALWPASVSAAWAFKKELAQQNKIFLLVLGIASFLGGAGGAILLIQTPQTTFTRMIPFLMLAATLLFAFSPMVNARLKQRIETRRKEGQEEKRFSGASLTGLGLAQLAIAVYGGYFGGGIGILMLATLGLMGMENIHEMNAVKNTLNACINGVAIITFIIVGKVVWVNALTMIVGAIIGGFGGAYFARKLDPRVIRGFVILVGCAMTVIFFFKYGFL